VDVPTSQRKIEANRANARKSTGPRTARGKRAASRNALVHGLTSRAALLPGDDSREFRRFALLILDELDPHGPLEEELAGEIANASWKLRRSAGAEAILMEENHRGEQGDAPPLRVIVNMILSKRVWDHEPASPVWLLDRYTRNLERSRASAVRMLLSLQKRRREREEAEADAAGVDGTAGDGEIEPLASPLRNEANGPAGGDAAQPQAPQADAAAAGGPDRKIGAPGEAS
jgi:hypothetical protein